MTKPTKWHVHPATTQISLGICPVWSESSLCAHWVVKDPMFLHANSEDFDQTGRIPRLIWVFAGRTDHFVGFIMLPLIWWQLWTSNWTTLVRLRNQTCTFTSMYSSIFAIFISSKIAANEKESYQNWGARWLSGRVSDSGARGPGFETYRRRVVSLSKTLYSPKVLVNYPGSDGSVPIWLKNCWLGR